MIFRSNPFPIIITIQIVQIKTTLSKDHYFKGNINLRALLTDKFNKQVIQIGSKILRKDHLINKILSTNRPWIIWETMSWVLSLPDWSQLNVYKAFPSNLIPKYRMLTIDFKNLEEIWWKSLQTNWNRLDSKYCGLLMKPLKSHKGTFESIWRWKNRSSPQILLKSNKFLRRNMSKLKLWKKKSTNLSGER